MATNQNQTAEFDINALLEGTLDDIEDLPQFKAFPTGLYVCILTLEQKKIGDHPAIEAKFKLVDVKELSDKSATPPNVGDTTNIAYMLDNKYGAGNLKVLLTAAAEKFGKKTNKDLISDCQNAEVTVIFDVRSGKGDKSDQEYQQLKEIAFN